MQARTKMNYCFLRLTLRKYSEKQAGWIFREKDKQTDGQKDK
jgi:hypothetical protein